MRKIIIFIFSILWQYSTAQVILIKPNLANCVKCSIKLGSDFNAKRTGIPTYLVFSTTAIADSSEIENSLRCKENGMRIVFSDKMLRYFKDAVDVIYINVNGKVLIQKNLFSITGNDIDLMVKDYEENFKFLYTPSKSYTLVGDNLLAIDNQLNSANLFTATDTFNYKLTQEINEKVKKKINGLYPGIFAMIDNYLTEKPQFKFIMKPSVGNYSIHDSNIYLTTQVPFLYNHRTNSDTLDLQYLYALIKFHKDSCTVYPIHIPYLVDSNYWPKGYNIPDNIPNFFLGRNCIFKNDSTVIFTFTNSEKPTERKPHKFLGEFKLQAGVYYYVRQLNVDLPELYKQNNIAYPDPYTYTSLWRADYPYFTTAIYPSVINLNNEETYNYQLPFNINLPDTVKLEIEKAPLQNIFIYNDFKRKFIYIVSMINGKKTLQVLSNDKKVALKKIIDLRHLGFTNEAYEYFQIIAEENMVYAADTNGYVRGYPLDLLLFE